MIDSPSENGAVTCSLGGEQVLFLRQGTGREQVSRNRALDLGKQLFPLREQAGNRSPVPCSLPLVS
jgi:hypothetical protein